MATAFVQALNTTSQKTASTTVNLSITGKTVAVGNAIFVGITSDTGGTGYSVTDNLGNTYTLVHSNTQASSVFTQLWKATVTTGGSITAITASWTNNITATCISAAEFSDVGTQRTTSGQAFPSGSSVAVSSVVSAACTAGELVIGVHGCENPTLPTAQGGTLIGRAVTSGGGAASNMSILFSYEIVVTDGNYGLGASIGTTSGGKAAAGVIFNAPVSASPQAMAGGNQLALMGCGVL